MDSDIFFTLIPIVAGFWVYFDALSNRIGSYRDEKNKLQGHSPVWWGVLTILLVIITLPLYLFLRKGLLKTAEEHPANSDKSIGLLVMIIASGIVIWYLNFR